MAAMTHGRWYRVFQAPGAWKEPHFRGTAHVLSLCLGPSYEGAHGTFQIAMQYRMFSLRVFPLGNLVRIRISQPQLILWPCKIALDDRADNWCLETCA